MLPCSPQPDSQTQAAVKHANVSAHHYPKREGGRRGRQTVREEDGETGRVSE